MTTSREQPLAEADARLIAWDFRQKFKNSDAFEAAWHALFELRSAITPSLARRFMGEELLKYRAHLVGLEEPPTAPTPLRPNALSPDSYQCPGCERRLPSWVRDGHADDCRHANCYELEVRFREGKRHQAAKRAVTLPPAPDSPPPV